MSPLFVASALAITATFIGILSCLPLQEPYDYEPRSTESRLRDRVAVVSGGYRVLFFRGFLSHSECRELIELAHPRLEVAKVHDHGPVVYKPESRTSMMAWLKDGESQACGVMASAVSVLAGGRGPELQEECQVAMYHPGGRFETHCDACISSDEAVCKEFNRGMGHRIGTLLVYLNADFGGGETFFESLPEPIRVRPETGLAIFFESAVPNPEAPGGADLILPQSYHRGAPVVAGEKWIATKWVHCELGTA